MTARKPLRRLVLLASLLGLLVPVHTAQAHPPRRNTSVTPDFSTVTTRAAAENLAKKGALVRVLLYPAQLGGEDVAENVAYIPPEAAAAQELMIGTLERFARQGLIDKLSVRPSYKGDRFIPSAITYEGIRRGKTGGFSPTIKIW